MATGGTFQRGLSYCLNEDCSEHARGVFWLNFGPNVCAACRGPVVSVPETRGPAEPDGRGPWSSVEVLYNYQPLKDQYAATAIVMIDADEGSRYRISSPLVQTSKRALQMAEQALAGLQCGSSRMPQVALDLDSPDYAADLRRWADKLRVHALASHGY